VSHSVAAKVLPLPPLVSATAEHSGNFYHLDVDDSLVSKQAFVSHRCMRGLPNSLFHSGLRKAVKAQLRVDEDVSCSLDLCCIMTQNEFAKT